MKRMHVAMLAVAVVVGLSGAVWAVAADPVNDKCPVDGKAVAGKTSEVKVGLCCGGCEGKFEKDPAKSLAKVEKLPNEKCPVSGKKPGDASATATIGFCSDDCKKQFDADPSKFLSKVTGKAKDAK